MQGDFFSFKRRDASQILGFVRSFVQQFSDFWTISLYDLISVTHEVPLIDTDIKFHKSVQISKKANW